VAWSTALNPAFEEFVFDRGPGSLKGRLFPAERREAEWPTGAGSVGPNKEQLRPERRAAHEELPGVLCETRRIQDSNLRGREPNTLSKRAP
jgi:hypothetical protein